MEDEPLTPETLQARLQKYHAAFESEFKLAEEAANTEGESSKEITQRFFKEHVPVAAAHIIFLAQNSTSDAVRLSACKEIIKLGLESDVRTGDPIADLIEKLKKNDEKVPAN